MTDILTLRKALIKDLQLLQHWNNQPHVTEALPESDWEWETELLHDPEWREQLIAELNGEAIGFVQIIDPFLEETHYWGEVAENLRAIDIWIGEKHNLNQGYGTTMMQLAIDLCFANNKVKAILIDPLSTNISAIRFYKRLGFQYVESKNFNGTHCDVLRLERNNWTRK